MIQFKHSFVVNSDIDTVWKFYTNIKHLEVITPNIMNLEIIKSQNDVLQQGTEVWLKAKLLTKSRWHSKITYLKQYEYTDEMISGRFKLWQHLHIFNKLGDEKTEVIDQVNFELPYGLIGKLFENYVLKKLETIFSYREKATINALKRDSTNLTH
jgi:ligand-binding SRPBCC domain-containing protein